MENQIFRKKSIERVSSPEQLNDYVRVSNPGVWMILIAVIILLVGICIWGIFGHLDTKLEVAGICQDGKMVCYVSDSEIKKVQTGMHITVNDTEYEIADIASDPFCVSDDMDSYAMHIGNLQPGQWVYAVTADTELKDGTYNVQIVTESVSPLSFVLN